MRGAERDRRRRRRRASTSRGSSAARCSAARSSSPARASRPASCAARLEALGAEVIELPAIAIEPVDVALPDARRRYDWLVFTSANGVDAFFDAASPPRGLDARALAGVRVAGDRAGHRARAARRAGVRADLVPDRVRRRVAARRVPEPDAPGAAVLLARAEQARDVLPDGLAERGYAVDVLARVPHGAAPSPTPTALARVRDGGVDAITFTSSSTVTNFCDLLGTVPDPQPLVVSIGPVPRTTARARGLAVDAEADPHTIDGLVDALVSTLQR